MVYSRDMFPDASKAKKTSIKWKLAVKRGGKLTHGTHIHAGHGISGPGEGGMRGVVKKKPSSFGRGTDLRWIHSF